MEFSVHDRTPMMQEIKTFLETSTIHGLSYISTGKNYVRIFWVLIVTAGFMGAGVLIKNSFKFWAESPVKTAIETHSITEITFPKLTVCPPKNTYTDLNYDLMMSENRTLDNDTRTQLANYAKVLLYDDLHEGIMRIMRKLEDNDRYYNWYQGFTKITIPHYGKGSYWADSDGSNYDVETSATSGTILTQDFGDKFDADKVETRFRYGVVISPPYSVVNNTNVTLHIEIEQYILRELSAEGEENLVWGCTKCPLNTDITHTSKNYTPPGSKDPKVQRSLQLTRKVLMSDVKNQKLNLMPGFKLSWHYSGMEVEQVAIYINPETNAFVRNVSKSSVSQTIFKCFQKPLIIQHLADPLI